MNNNKNNNPYGHLLDKYLDGAHFDYRTEEQKKEEERARYGNLLDNTTGIIQYGKTCSVFMKAVRE